MDKLLKKDKSFKAKVIKLLTKLEEGLKNKFWKKSNIEKSDDDEEDRRLWGEGGNTSVRRLTQEKDLEFSEYQSDKGRQLNLDNQSMVESNFAPSSPSMFIKPEDLPKLRKYIHNPVGPSPKERKLFETYYKDKSEFAELEKGMTHYQKKDFYRKLEMMSEFQNDISGSGKSGDENSSSGAEGKSTGVASGKSDGVVAANNQTVNHVERVQGESVSPDGLTQTEYATVDQKSSSNSNSSEDLSGVGTLESGVGKFSQKLTKLAGGDMRRLDESGNEISQAAAAKVLKTTNDGAGSQSEMKTLHVEKNSGEGVSEDGLTRSVYKSEDISQTHQASQVENLTTVNTVASKVSGVTSAENSEVEKETPLRRLNRQLVAEDLQMKADEIYNLDRLAKESGIVFNYSEVSNVSLVQAENYSGLTAFGINPVEVRNLNALGRLETVLKERPMGQLIEEKLAGGKLVGMVLAALAFVLGSL